MEKVNVIKVGGAVVEDAAALQSFLTQFASVEGLKVLVHGGGRSATAMAARLGIETKMLDGRRITDEAMLEVVTMVYGGLVNKNIVACMQAIGLNAIGLTGADLDCIRSDKRPSVPIDYGFAGDVRKVNGAALHKLLAAGFVPVMAPLTHDGKGQLLNTNADTIAAEVAKGLVPYYDVTLTFCFEKKGVLANPQDEDSVIPRIDHASYAALVADGTLSGGMLPKFHNAFAALDTGVTRVVITSAANLNGGSEIVKNEE
ncbi:MAG: acetylglutamate kinase [Bacteroidaceae bacterium]|nr:acetylglutamate kinase [Bacteroidaceae bacterium]